METIKIEKKQINDRVYAILDIEYTYTAKNIHLQDIVKNSSASVYISDIDINKATEYKTNNVSIVDGYYCLHLYYSTINIYNDGKTLQRYTHIDVYRFFTFLKNLKTGIKTTVNMQRFEIKNIEKPEKTWAVLLQEKTLHSSAKQVIKNVLKEKPDKLQDIKNFLQRYTDSAMIYGEDKFNFYFDGRKQYNESKNINHCGYNGGFILHSNNQYSIHT